MRKISAALLAVVSLSLAAPPAPAEPPPWAKAHGWRKKNDPNYVGYTGKKWPRDYGVIEGRCDTDKIGAVLGGVVGGVIGSKVGSEENRPVAIIVGTVLGAVVGAKIGRALDEADRACMGHALELAGEHRTVVWTNPRTGVRYELTPTRNLGDAKNPCREFTTKVSRGKTSDVVKGVACRRGAGDWVFKS
ncbi:MAG TPA: RT0821/Lpp0805 family surface protein [Burkholderiales bacterium]